jgi:anthranilate synthase/aminodeoxychorismate synthase-like glutamine amidotransferase
LRVILIIDNYDSFTWNLVHRLGEIDPAVQVRVERNDRITPEQVEAMGPERIIISPGPCGPREAGNSPEIVRRLAGRVPILGVCLGHQCIGDVFGMRVVRHSHPVHGKTSEIHHDGQGIFAGLPNPFIATRYHSLVVAPESVPSAGWAVSAWSEEVGEDGAKRRIVQGLRRVWEGGGGSRPDAKAPLEGVQFHPESFLTEAGPRLLANFLALPVAGGVGAESRANRASVPRGEEGDGGQTMTYRLQM